MASRGKKKTTFAKLARETRLRERRLNKQVRKDARKLSAETGDTVETGETGETTELADAVETVPAEDAA